MVRGPARTTVRPPPRPAMSRTRRRTPDRSSRPLPAGAFPVVGASGRVGTLVRLHVGEARVALDEGQLGLADGTVPLLADDDLGDALVGAVLVVDLVPVDEEDEVGVLLDGPRFPEVGEDGTLVPGTLLHLPRELRKCQDGDVQVAREDLEAP